MIQIYEHLNVAEENRGEVDRNWDGSQKRIHLQPGTLEGLHKVLEYGFHFNNNVRLPEDIDWHEATSEELRKLVTFQRFDFESYQIYTDGSAGTNVHDQKAAAWAFVVLGQHARGRSLIHWDCGQVEDDPNQPMWAGASDLNAQSGETAALQRAIIWCLHQNTGHQVELRFDCQNVGYAAIGKWAHKEERRDQRILRALAQALEVATENKLSGTHVKAHSGEGFNELVNTLAGEAMRQKWQMRDPELDLRTCMQGKRCAMEWWWLIMQTQRQDPTLPEFHGSRLCWTQCKEEPTVEKAWPQDTIRRKKTAIAKLKLIQYNVLSIADNEGPYGKDEGLSHYAALLRAQLTEQQVHVAGFQETRAKSSGVVQSATWIRYVSQAAARGKGGCEIWLNRELAIDEKGEVTFKAENTVVIHSSPTQLVIKTRLGQQDYIIIAAQGPHSGKTEEEITEWWQQLREIVQRQGEGATCIGLIDANAHFQRGQEPHIGTHQLEVQSNAAAMQMLRLLQDTNTCAINTFPSHEGPGHTWTHWKGTLHRNDYIIIPTEWNMPGAVQSWTDRCIDTGTNALDHTPLLATMRYIMPLGGGTRPGKALDVAKIAKLTEEQMAQFFDRLEKPPWAMNVHEQGAQMVSTLQTALRQQYGPTRRPPRKTYISDDSWHLRTERVDIKRNIDSEERALQTRQLRCYFMLWREGPAARMWKTAWNRERQKACKAISSQWQQLQQKQKELKRQLRKDRTTAIDEIARQAQEAPGHLIYKKLRAAGVGMRQKRSHIQPLNLMIFDGKKPETLEEYWDGWRQHFEKQEDGHLCEPETLLRRCWLRQRKRPNEVNAEDIPTLLDLETAFKATKAGKAHFYDMLPPELAHAGSKWMARYMYSLLLKQFGELAEPICLKGGCLVHAYKGKGAASDPQNHRALMVSSVLAKCFHRCFRQDIGEDMEDMALPLQLGGRPKRGVNQAAHAVISFASWKRAAKTSHAILFVDISQAYYRLFRQCITMTSDFDDAAVKLFQELGLPPEEFHSFCEALKRDNAFQDRPHRAYQAEMIDETLNSTWFNLRGDARPSVTNRGSRPGDSIADTLFSFAFCSLMADVTKQLRQEELLEQIPWNRGAASASQNETDENLELLGPIWADDLAMLLSSDNPIQLIPKIQRYATVTAQRLRRAGMQVNFSAGKTEVAIRLFGADAKSAKEQVYRHAQPCIPLEEVGVSLKVAARYKHLGTLYVPSGSMMPEIRQRFGTANQRFTQLYRPIFARGSLRLQRKTALFTSLVLSGLWHNIAVWPQLSGKEATECGNKLYRLYRRLAVAHYGQAAMRWEQGKLYAMLQLPRYEDVHRTERLGYLRQLLQTGEDQLWALIYSEAKWLQQVQEDAMWLEQQVMTTLPTTPAGAHFDEWLDWIRSNPAKWSKVVKRGRWHATMQRVKQNEWDNWQHELLDQTWSSLGAAEPAALDMIEDPRSCHVCLKCKVSFKTKSAWSVHAFKKHGRKQEARNLVEGSQCPACRREYHHHVRLLRHVTTSEHCRRQLQGTPAAAHNTPGQGSRLQTLASEAAHQRPVLQAEGPAPEPEHQPRPEWLPQSLSGFQDQMSLLLLEVVDGPWDTCEDLIEGLRVAMQQATMHPQEAITFARDWVHDLQLCDGHARCSEIAQAIEAMSERLTAEWVHPGETWYREAPTSHGRRALETRIADLAKQLQLTRYGPIPPIRGRQTVFLHIFSGRRREGDLQEAIEKSGLHPALRGVALSVDIVIEEKQGNLLRQETWQNLVRAFEAGLITATVAGPPCETVSKARTRALYDAQGRRKGPRPIRSRSEAAGLGKLNQRELEQVIVANQLWGATLKLFGVALAHGAVALIEHPAAPPEPEAASLWRLPLVQCLLKHERVQLTTIWQGYYGGTSPKPTSFLLANGAHSPATIFAEWCTRERLPAAIQAGKNEKGEYHTAHLKEYPPDLCAAIAAYMRISVSQRPVIPESERLDVFERHPELKLLHSLLGQATTTERGPDFNPQGLAQVRKER